MSLTFFSQVFSKDTDRVDTPGLVRMSISHVYREGNRMELFKFNPRRTAVYYRISTKDKGKKKKDKSSFLPPRGQTIISQKLEVEKYIRDVMKIDPAKCKIFIDELSGKENVDRPGYNEMMKQVYLRKFDNIVVFKLDRFSRHAATAIHEITGLEKFNCCFISTSQPALQLGSDNIMRHIMLACLTTFAELERENIVDRVKAGMAAAKDRGVKFGRPSSLTEKLKPEILHLKFQKGYSIREIETLLKVSRASIARFIKPYENKLDYEMIIVIRDLKASTAEQTAIGK